MSDLIRKEDALMQARPEYLNPQQQKLASYNQGWNDALDEYVDRIEEIPSANRLTGEWILCNERLPKNEGWVIVTIFDESGDTPYRYTYFGWYLEAANCWIVDAEQRADVTAWMPLPEPYKRDLE